MITKKGTYGLLGSAKAISQGRARGRGQPLVGGKRVGPAHSTSALGFGAESSDDEVIDDPLSRTAVNRRLAAEQKMREGQVVVGSMIIGIYICIYVCVCVISVEWWYCMIFFFVIENYYASSCTQSDPLPR